MVFHNTLGLDIGHSAIKTVVCQKSLGRVPTFLSRGTRYPIGLNADDSTPEFREFLHAFLKRHQLLKYPTVASIPGDCVISRVLSFPFSNTQKISRTLPYELEPFVPVNVEDLVMDYHILNSTSRQTDVLAVAVPKEIVRQRIEFLTKAGVNVRGIEVQSLAMFNVYQWVHPQPSVGGTLLLDVGYGSISLCLIGPKGVWGIRTLLYHERDLAERLSSHTADLPEGSEEFRTPKNTRRCESGNPYDLSRIEISDSIDGLLQNIGTTIHAFECETNTNVVEAFLGGGGSRMKGLPAYFVSQLGLPNLRVLPVKVGTTQRQVSPVFLPALGLSIKFARSGKGSTANLMGITKQAEDESQATRATWGKIAAGVAVVAVLALINIFAIHHFKEARYEELREYLRSEFQEVFPGTQVVVNELQQTQTAMIQDQRTLQFLSGDHTTVLQILAELSQQLSQVAETEVQEVLIDGQTISLQATTRSFEAVERIKQKVSAVSWVHSLQVIDAQVGADVGRVSFGLNVQVKTV